MLYSNIFDIQNVQKFNLPHIPCSFISDLPIEHNTRFKKYVNSLFFMKWYIYFIENTNFRHCDVMHDIAYIPLSKWNWCVKKTVKACHWMYTKLYLFDSAEGQYRNNDRLKRLRYILKHFLSITIF